MMSEQQVKALAQRISNLGKGADVPDLLAALGIVVCQALNQLAPEERMVGTVGWIAVLAAQMKQAWISERTN